MEWGKETISRLLFIFEKSFIWRKSKCSAAYFQYISIALNLAYNENKLCKTFGYWSRDMLNFVLKKGLGIASPPPIVNHFKKNVSHVIIILLTDQI